MSSIVALALTTTLIAVAGCGGGSSESSSSDGTGSVTPLKLASYLPADDFTLSIVDLDAARKQLGLPADEDALEVSPEGVKAKPGSSQFTLSLFAGAGISAYELSLQNFAENPVASALDGSKITAAASNESYPADPVSVIETSQPFDEIAGSLKDAGYQQDGDTLSADPALAERSKVSTVAYAGDGIVVMAGGKADAGKLASSPPGGPKQLLTTIDGIDDPIQVASRIGDTKSCVLAFGGGNDSDGNGEMRFLIDGKPDPAAFEPKLFDGSLLTPGQPKADGKLLDVPFTASKSPGPKLVASPLLELTQNSPRDSFYDCP